jgi:hypothetical protein
VTTTLAGSLLKTRAADPPPWVTCSSSLACAAKVLGIKKALKERAKKAFRKRGKEFIKVIPFNGLILVIPPI